MGRNASSGPNITAGRTKNASLNAATGHCWRRDRGHCNINQGALWTLAMYRKSRAHRDLLSIDLGTDSIPKLKPAQTPYFGYACAAWGLGQHLRELVRGMAEQAPIIIETSGFANEDETRFALGRRPARRLSVWSTGECYPACGQFYLNLSITKSAGSRRRAISGWVQIALKPAFKGLGFHRVFIRSEGLMHAVADTAFKRTQVDARAC